MIISQLLVLMPDCSGDGPDPNRRRAMHRDLDELEQGPYRGGQPRRQTAAIPPVELLTPQTQGPQRWDGPLPKTTVEAMNLLLELIPVEEPRRIAATPEEDFRVLAHFALGLWVRNHFIYSGNPELCAACQADHPDQVSAQILDVLWERL